MPSPTNCQRKILPLQHVGHDVRARANHDAAGPPRVVRRAHVERPVEDGDDGRFVPVVADVLLRVRHVPVERVLAQPEGFARLLNSHRGEPLGHAAHVVCRPLDGQFVARREDAGGVEGQDVGQLPACLVLGR